MRIISLCIFAVLLMVSLSSYAKPQEANVNVILEIEGEYRFEPFKEESRGLPGLVNNGVLRVVEESEPGLAKYAALNQAMQKAREHVWNSLLKCSLTDDMTVMEAVKAAPPYTELKESDKEKAASLSGDERSEFIKKYGKEKQYDFEKVLEVIKECGTYKNSGRFYDAVEQKGYACLEVDLAAYMSVLDNDRINIFKGITSGENYRPVDAQNVSYDGIIIDARDTDYYPVLRMRVLSPTEEVVFAGVPGRRNIYFAKDMDEAKTLLASAGAHRVYNAKSIGAPGNVNLSVSLPSADRIYAASSKNMNIPFVIIYKEKDTENISADGE